MNLNKHAYMLHEHWIENRNSNEKANMTINI